jgi:hypothetical protein
MGNPVQIFPYFVPITQTQSTEPLVIIIHLLRFSCTVESCYLKVHGSLQNFELVFNYVVFIDFYESVLLTA